MSDIPPAGIIVRVKVLFGTSWLSRFRGYSSYDYCEGLGVIRHMKMTTSDPRTAHAVCFKKIRKNSVQTFYAYTESFWNGRTSQEIQSGSCRMTSQRK